LGVRGRCARVQLAIERGGELLRYAAWRSRSHWPAIELHDRRDVAGGAGDEQLVETADLLLQDGRLAHVHAFLDRELEHDVAGDARQDVIRSRIGPQLAV